MLNQQKSLELEACMSAADRNPPSLNALFDTMKLIIPVISKKVEVSKWCNGGGIHKVAEGENFDDAFEMSIGIDGKSHASVRVQGDRFEITEYHGPERELLITKSTVRAAWRCCGYANAPSIVESQLEAAKGRARRAGWNIGPSGGVPIEFFGSRLDRLRWRLLRAGGVLGALVRQLDRIRSAYVSRYPGQWF